MQLRLRTSLTATHSEAHADLVHAMGTHRYVDLMLALQDFLVDPPLTAVAAAEPAEVLPGLVARTVERVRSAAGTAAAAPENLAGWHEVRKLAKAARYSHEALAPLFGEQAAEIAAKWEAVTEAFGDLQDTRVGRDRVREVAHDAARAGESTAPYDRLIEFEVADGIEKLAVGRAALDAALAAPGLAKSAAGDRRELRAGDRG